ncbi:MAG: hypothetical protein O8C62_08080 [Candidatus Methanoperedens sp.]|nr:hypothetical protein [Candidatus Methanoperedens sp.]
MSSFEFFIQKPPNRSLFEFEDTNTIERQNIQFTVSKDDFIKILAPFSKTGGLKQPKKDSDTVTLEVRTTGVIFLQSTLDHESNEINIRLGEGTWNSLPNEDWEFSISPKMLSEYILRMAASAGTKVKFRQVSNTLWIESDAGKEKIPMESSKPKNCQINISRITLLKVKAQLNDYENCKVGVRNNFIIIEGEWEQGICRWKLDAIHEFSSP